MELHDILPPIEIMNYTFFAISLFVLGIITLLLKYLFKREKKDAKYYLNILEQCNFQDSKKTALQFSYYGKLIFIDEETQVQFLELEEKMKHYKYIQHSSILPQDLEDKILQLLQQAKEQYA